MVGTTPAGRPVLLLMIAEGPTERATPEGVGAARVLWHG